jgi:hypothetical protein
MPIFFSTRAHGSEINHRAGVYFEKRFLQLFLSRYTFIIDWMTILKNLMDRDLSHMSDQVLNMF